MLLEMLAAIAIAAVVLAAVADLAGTALRNWNRGGGTIAAMEMLTRGLGRLETDLSLAVPMPPPGSNGSTVLFQGDASNMFFVAATGFGSGDRGLEMISVSIVPDRDGILVVRQRGPAVNPPTSMRDPVILLRGRMQVRFSYRDKEGKWVGNWTARSELPTAVNIEILGPSGQPVFPVAVALPLPVNLSVDCLNREDENPGKTKRCADVTGEQPQEAKAGENPQQGRGQQPRGGQR